MEVIVKYVVVIIGPTASGKTNISIELAKKINGEIISADSMQVYKHMDIGTAKPTKDEMQGVQHYLIDEIEPFDVFSVAQYKKLALEYIDDIAEKGKTPILCGGTGLYINSVIYNIEFSETIRDIKFREKLMKEAKEKGNRYIHDKLKIVDFAAAEKIHENNVKRVVRALEVYELSHKTISEQQKNSRRIPPKYKFVVIGLNIDRKLLYERIEKRVNKMVDSGLIEEVAKLRNMGLNRNHLSMQGIGYKEILSNLNGEISINEAIEAIKKGTRNYAKRQMTWFRKIEDTVWIDVDENTNPSDIAVQIEKMIIG
jgi:tRNA dimethylallyltransferase